MAQYSQPTQPGGGVEEQENLARAENERAEQYRAKAREQQAKADDLADRLQVAREKAERIRAEIEGGTK